MNTSSSSQSSPLLREKDYPAPSVFTPENLLREARRQKGLSEKRVPAVCVLDPDGDVVRTLRRQGRARSVEQWPCYHTDLYEIELDGSRLGIVGCAVGGPFAVLVAEELFASGCRLLISVTSSGQIIPQGEPPYFVLIEKALRDEGTSHHYLPPSNFAHLDAGLRDALVAMTPSGDPSVYTGASWTTDAPFRETEAAIEAARRAGILAVEMEAAALYAFAAARNRDVVCFAHVTNQMAREEGDFEKGEENGANDALSIISCTLKALQATRTGKSDASGWGGGPCLDD